MPELPDVEIFKAYLNRTSLHQTIGSVTVSDVRILEGISAKKLRSRLARKQILGSDRHGKLLFARVDGAHLVMHFGMTGELQYFKDEGKTPQYARVLIGFTNGFHLAYDSRRKLGRIRLVDEMDRYVAKEGLGPDALASDFDTFKGALESRQGYLKLALMDQHVIAGIGNIYSDEILFWAGIHPKHKTNDLDQKAWKRLFRAAQQVLHMAIRKRADPDRLPKSYLIPHRGRGGECPKCGAELRTVKIGGRRAYYCPNDQAR
jgi:formamidopyrimidine-DNA glycosylase